MKAVKRVRYGEKEKIVLNKMLDEAKASGALKTAQDIREVSTHLDLEFLHKI